MKVLYSLEAPKSMLHRVGFGIALLLPLSTGCNKDKPIAGTNPNSTATASSHTTPANSTTPAGEMVRIPAHTFVNESDAGVDHEVRINAFEMDKTEVTVRAYRACVEAGACVAHNTVEWEDLTEPRRKLYSRPCNWGKPDRDTHPMNCVDWHNAEKFCAWAGKRLPTEQEWEYAARGKEGKKHPWGDEPPNPMLLNACGPECVKWAKEDWDRIWGMMYDEQDPWPNTAPVGSFPLGASPFGLLDMAGNVWEWTSSSFEEGKDYRVTRGASWNNDCPKHAVASFRNRLYPSTRNCNLGFRCVR